MDARTAFNVTESGYPSAQPMLFAHGFGCDQNMWRLVAPHFTDFRVITFDYVGSGGAQEPYDSERYSTLDGYARDVLRICRELELSDVVFVGHSVSAMIGVLADREAPGTFASHVMVGPSPRYINDADYVGGFEHADIEGLLESLASNYLGWSAAMAPVIMDNPGRPELGRELEKSFCTVDPDVAERVARATFGSVNRDDLRHLGAPALVLQARNDAIAPMSVGQFVADEVPEGTLALIDAVGHCPHLSAPEAVVAAMREFLEPAMTVGA